MNLKIAGCAMMAIAAFTFPAQAHHSFAMFDQEKMISVSGTVKEFEWSNPHAWIHLTVVDEGTGRSVDWAFEMGSVGQIAAQGWKSDSIKPGDKITVSGHPLRDGSRGGQYRSVKFADGSTINQRPDANATNQNAIPR
jgi:Family of unknown function (DUF6152)